MTPKGFIFSTVEAAIKKPGRPDMALIFSKTDAVAAGAFTTNSVKAAPVRLCMRRIKSGKGRAIVVNSGNANACTGKQGLRDAETMTSIVAQKTRISPSQTYVCSTGVIGNPMPMDRVAPALDTLVSGLGKAGFHDVARAIMTTDTFPKLLHKRIKIGGTYGTISGVCKGAGMIAPNMATMLCFIITDIAVEQGTLAGMLRESVKASFNRITIDGDMSTNDTVLLLANGAIANAPITAKSRYYAPFKRSLDEVLHGLSKLIAKDGEGATKLIEVFVKGAGSASDAEKAAFAVANSLLVKTAVYGNDANWGRIMAALGYSGARFKEEKTDISFNNVMVVRGGLSNNKDKKACAALKSKEINITIDLRAGKATAKVLTCDFTEDYVRINAEYRT